MFILRQWSCLRAAGVAHPPPLGAGPAARSSAHALAPLPACPQAEADFQLASFEASTHYALEGRWLAPQMRQLFPWVRIGARGAPAASCLQGGCLLLPAGGGG